MEGVRRELEVMAMGVEFIVFRELVNEGVRIDVSVERGELMLIPNR